MILARMWQGVNIWKSFSFPLTIRDQNCVMSSVILAFGWPILEEWTNIPCGFILPENEKTVLARMWLAVIVFDMIQFSIHNWRPELSDMERNFLAFCWPIGDDCSTFWGKFIPAENEKRWFWLECDKGSNLFFWHDSVFHSPLETRTVWHRV
jgi:hypothetical protein